MKQKQIVEELQEIVGGIAKKYADLVHRYIDMVQSKEIIEKSDLEEINEGIRMLNHVAGTLWKLSACIDDTNAGTRES